ncbi:hypothetical protein D3C81_1311440 [compost metagenome]
MVAAVEVVGMADTLGQRQAAVGAGIMVGLDAVLTGTYYDNRVIDDVVGVVVANLGNLFQSAGQLPDVRPQPLLFAAREGRVDIGVLWHEVVPNVFRREFLATRFH